jgi:hypothetical protein
MVAFEVLLSDLMGIKTFPVISWLVLDQSVDKALSVRMSLLLNLYLGSVCLRGCGCVLIKTQLAAVW